MALEGTYIRVTHAGASTGAILLNDINSGFLRESADRVRRPGPVYVPANGYVDLVVESTVILSYENGAIRQFVDAGELTVSMIGGATQVLTFLYDFDVQGGAVGQVVLTGIQGSAKQVPANCIALRGWLEVVTQFVGPGASLTVGPAANEDGWLTAVAVGALTDNSLHPFDGAEVANGVTETKYVAATDVEMDILAAPFTAGKAYIHVECLAAFE